MSEKEDISVPIETNVSKITKEYEELKRLRKKKPFLFFFIISLAGLSIFLNLFDRFKGMPAIEKENAELKDKLVQKNAVLQQLQIEFAPFKTYALEKYGGDEKQALLRLAQKLTQLDHEMENILNYEAMSRLDALGQLYTGDLIDNSSLARTLRSQSHTLPNGNIEIQKDRQAEAVYKGLIDKYPNFPFSYYFLALCLNERKDDQWLRYAEQAKTILEFTTKIDGHNPAHDDVLKRINEMIQSAETK